MNDNEVVLSSRLPISLEKKWIDPKIIKTPVEVSVKKLFALDINLSAVEGKLATAKTQLIRKIFSTVNGFGEATTLSKFEGIIRSMFTLEKSIEMATLLAGENKIVVNTNLKKQRVCSDRAVMIKKIPIDMLKNMIVTTVTKFGEIKSIRIQLIGMWQKTIVEFAKSSQANLLVSKWSFLIEKDLVHVVKAAGDRDVWSSRDQFRVLLSTLPVRMTAHDLGTLLERAEGKTCIINHSLETGNRFCCAVIGFESNEELKSAFLTEPIFGGICLSWARLNLVQCGKCERFGHSVLECDASDVLPFVSFELLKRPFFGTNCLQLARLYAKKNVPISCPTVFGGKSWAQVVSSAFSSGGSPSSSGLFFGGMPLVVGLSSHQVVSLNDCLAVLEHSLEILSDQISVILKKLSFIDLVSLAASFCAPSLAVSVPSALVVDSNMTIDNMLALADPSFSGSSGSATVLSSSGSKVFISKIGGLESKMSALEASFGSILVRLDLLCSGSGFFGAGVAIIMADFFTCHVTKIEKVSGHVMVVHLLFKNKLSVSVVGLYMGASSGTHFGQASEVNSVIAKAVNSSCFIILGGDFNENGSERNVNFKFCLELGLVNLFAGYPLVSNSTWSNSRGVEKTIDFIFVSESLASAITGHGVGSVFDFFDTDHCVSRFKDCTSAKLLAVSGGFLDTLAHADVDDMWVFLEKMLVDSADEIFLRHWFSCHNCQVGGKSLDVLKQLSLFWKEYRKSKMYKSKLAEEASVWKAIESHMEKFCSDKGAIIRNVLNQPFRKVVFDHLVVNDKLVLEPGMVKLGVDEIMKGWTRKRTVSLVVPDVWARQYAPLDYVKDNAFLGVMCSIDMSELLLVVNNLPNSKAAGLSGIPNEL
ncbi:hypothetical protein G9A89_008809 [Geosiphon pyriformis]|nr:hypothetical protein G9A89_008809 [Geosiphon pyriformis]